MDRIAIIGLGLMGSSLGLALKKNRPDVTVRGYARQLKTRRIACDRGIADLVFDTPQEAVSGADVIVICVPIWSIADLLKQIVPSLSSGAVVTDVGSTKAELLKQASEVFDEYNAFFVGSHPIAGSEKTGITAGNAELYNRRVTAVCPLDETPPEAVKKVIDLWECVGSEVVQMSGDRHDDMLASTSHLPHMAAAALARAVAGDHPEKRAEFCGTGFKDTTRVASGSADMWVDIIDTNRGPLARELDHFHQELQGLIHILKTGSSEDIRRWLEEAADVRNEILNKNRFYLS